MYFVRDWKIFRSRRPRWHPFPPPPVVDQWAYVRCKIVILSKERKHALSCLISEESNIRYLPTSDYSTVQTYIYCKQHQAAPKCQPVSWNYNINAHRPLSCVVIMLPRTKNTISVHFLLLVISFSPLIKSKARGIYVSYLSWAIYLARTQTSISTDTDKLSGCGRKCLFYSVTVTLAPWLSYWKTISPSIIGVWENWVNNVKVTDKSCLHEHSAACILKIVERLLAGHK